MSNANSNKMYLTKAEAAEKGLPSNEEQIARWNALQAEIRAAKKEVARG